MGIDRGQLLDVVRALELPDGEYVVFGSGPLVVRGLRDGGDIDLVVTPELYARLEAAGWQVVRKDDGGELLRHDVVEALVRLDFPGYRRDPRTLVDAAEYIEGVPFTPLTELRTFKAALGRPKDQVDLDLIDAALARDGRPASVEGQATWARQVLAERDSRRTWRPRDRAGGVRGVLTAVVAAVALLILVGFVVVLAFG